MRNPSLLAKRGERLERARAALNESGYQYRKGKSRSKQVGSGGDSTPKRPKFIQEFREQRLADTEEELKTINTSISFKESRIEASSKVKNFKVRDQLSEEIDVLQQRRHVLQNEQKALVKKEKRSKHYREKRKAKPIEALASDSVSGPSSQRSTLSPTPPVFSPPNSRTSSRSYSPASVDRHHGVDPGGYHSGDTIILSGSESGDACSSQQPASSHFL